MASSLRLPAGSFLLVSASAITQQCQRRAFSQSAIHRAMKAMPQNVSIKHPAQPSMRTRGGQISKADLPTDLGLLPGTYIKPLWRDMPSIFELPRERLHLEWLWIKQGFQNIVGVVAYSKWMNKGMPLRLKERRQIGRELHHRMYTAFAEGDLTTLRKICCAGLAKSLSARITNRPKDETVAWSLDKYIRSPATFFTGVRVIADRATQIPDIPNSGVRQVVLRINSRQSTGKTKLPPPMINKRGLQQHQQDASRTEVEPGPTKSQDCTEYIVIQKLMWYGEEQDWRVWGYASPTTVEDLESPLFASGIPMADRLEAMKNMMGR